MKIREAHKEDIISIVKMLADDQLGALRENYDDPLPEVYFTAFSHIEEDQNQELLVVETEEGEIVGTMQLSFLRYLTYQGGIRAQIEGVRIRQDQRGKRIGEKMIKWAIQRAKDKKAHVVQLTTDKKRDEAILFYEKLGFSSSHEGMKLHLL